MVHKFRLHPNPKASNTLRELLVFIASMKHVAARPGASACAGVSGCCKPKLLACTSWSSWPVTSCHAACDLKLGAPSTRACRPLMPDQCHVVQQAPCSPAILFWRCQGIPPHLNLQAGRLSANQGCASDCCCACSTALCRRWTSKPSTWAPAPCPWEASRCAPNASLYESP